MIISHIGKYHIGQSAHEAQGLKEFSDEEYEMFAAAGSPRNFETEQIFYGEDCQFAGLDDWEVTIGSIKDKIYKIALIRMSNQQYVQKHQLKDIVKYINGAIGKYNEHSPLSSKYVWQNDAGNIIVNLRKAKTPDGSNVFVTDVSATSSIINDLVR